MKLSLLLLSLASTASAFQLAPTRVATISPFFASATDDDDLKPNDWTGYPVGDKRSTMPISARKINPFQRATMQDVMIDPNFTLAVAFAALGPLIMWYHPCK
jgi:hypothetical protein